MPAVRCLVFGLRCPPPKPTDINCAVERDAIGDLQRDNSARLPIPGWRDDAGAARHSEVLVLRNANDLNVARGVVAVFQSAAARIDGDFLAGRVD